MYTRDILRLLKNKDLKVFICGDGCIRFTKGKELRKYCPLTAAYKIKFNRYLDVCSYTAAARKLGVSDKICNNIMWAADAVYPFVNRPEVAKIRKQLLELCNQLIFNE